MWWKKLFHGVLMLIGVLAVLVITIIVKETLYSFLHSPAPASHDNPPVTSICVPPVRQADGRYLYYNGDTDSEPCQEQNLALVAFPSYDEVFLVCDRPPNSWKCELKLDPGQDYQLVIGNFRLSIDRPTP
jgi:hypothetical protein